MFSYCNNNPVNYIDPSGDIALIDDVLVGGVIVAAVIAISIVIMPPPPIQWEINQAFNSFSNAISQGIEQTANILFAKTKGKENIRDSGLVNETDEEVIRKAHDNKLPKSERQRYKQEEKARGIRNAAKRKMLY